MSPLYDLPMALERVSAARQAIDESGHDVLLTPRAECYHFGHPDPLHESVLFTPGLQSLAEIKTRVEAVAPKPLNLLLGGISIAMAADVAETTQIDRPPRGREEVPVQLSRLLDAHQVIIR